MEPPYPQIQFKTSLWSVSENWQDTVQVRQSRAKQLLQFCKTHYKLICIILMAIMTVTLILCVRFT